MQVIVTIPHDIYQCEKVKEIFDARFCTAARWTEEYNYPAQLNEKVYIIDNETFVQVGWRVRNNEFLSPDVKVLEDLKIDKLAELASARYLSEISGVIFNGIKIRTDRESQALITGAVVQAINDSTYTCKWKTVNGFIDLDVNMIKAVGVAVREHVQSQFNKEAELILQVEATTTIEELEAIQWNI